MKKEDVIKVFKDNQAMLEGHFLLTSGRHSDRYLQCALVLQDPAVVEVLAKELAAKIPNNEMDIVIGPALGGVTLAYEMARQLGTKALFAERENGVMTLRRGFKIPAEAKVLVVEDVVTTGGSVLEVIEVVKKAGGQVKGVASLVDRSNGKVEFGYPYYSLLPLEVISYEAKGCPLCAQGLPLVKPGSRMTAK
ncbi:MAG: orotate phosphoribosyltransferase [Firmicutes bacterium HGW-Firmicutes-12]|nr:MAG: orotate phosphoribosyltransferase [Firmicutes bacterium HGW-Firmicutes-12]